MNQEQYLRKLPQALDAKQRIALESVGVASEMIQCAMDRIHALSLVVVNRGERPKFLSLERAALFIDAWSIIDQANNMRVLLKALLPQLNIDVVRAYIEHADGARKLRNKMDHLAQDIPNLARRKDPMPPVHGCVSFIWAMPEDVEGNDSENDASIPRRFRVVMEAASAFQHPTKIDLGLHTGLLRRAGCDQFILHAFDYAENLTALAEDAVMTAGALSAVVERQCALELSRIGQRDAALPLVYGTTIVVDCCPTENLGA